MAKPDIDWTFEDAPRDTAPVVEAADNRAPGAPLPLGRRPLRRRAGALRLGLSTPPTYTLRAQDYLPIASLWEAGVTGPLVGPGARAMRWRGRRCRAELASHRRVFQSEMIFATNYHEGGGVGCWATLQR